MEGYFILTPSFSHYFLFSYGREREEKGKVPWIERLRVCFALSERLEEGDVKE